MKNKFNLNDVVRIKYSEEYKIVGMRLNTYNKPKKIWYDIYRLSDGYVCTVAENVLEFISEYNETKF